MVLPPGPFLGYATDVLTGDLVFFHGLGNNILVLNSMGAINDLLDKRASNYSHRPVFTVVGELMGLDRVCQLFQTSGGIMWLIIAMTIVDAFEGLW
jgi:hypothetical protein